jgi:ABC-type nitrate/sulfonate/bicarbonate transport system ATPase subunit
VDEPASALDLISAQDVRDPIDEPKHVTAAIVTHDLERAVRSRRVLDTKRRNQDLCPIRIHATNERQRKREIWQDVREFAFEIQRLPPVGRPDET